MEYPEIFQHFSPKPLSVNSLLLIKTVKTKFNKKNLAFQRPLYLYFFAKKRANLNAIYMP